MTSTPKAETKPRTVSPKPTITLDTTNLRFDFNAGIRLHLPPSAGRTWIYQVDCADTHTTIIRGETQADDTDQDRLFSTRETYYIRARVMIWERDTETQEITQILDHTYNAENRKVLITMPERTLGDTIAWIGYAARFAHKHDCQLTLTVSPEIAALYRETWPNIRMVRAADLTEDDLSAFYATYSVGLFFHDPLKSAQPIDFRRVGLGRTAGYILGVDPTTAKPPITLPPTTPPIADPYVCIATQSTMQAKYWNNPNGWKKVIAFLKNAGYRVICIDKLAFNGQHPLWNHTPAGAEDETGDRPLQERVRWLTHCDFFIGLSSGLSWLAWSAGADVLMISGFTHPTNEFETPWRAFNQIPCNSCWDDPNLRFDHGDYRWCPRHRDTPREYECTAKIAPEYVIDLIRTMPKWKDRTSRPDSKRSPETAATPP